MKVYTLSEEEGRYSDYSYVLHRVYRRLDDAKNAVTGKHDGWIALHEAEDDVRYRPERPTWECLVGRGWDSATYTIQEWEI